MTRKKRKIEELENLVRKQAEQISSLAAREDGYSVGLNSIKFSRNTAEFESYIQQMLLCSNLSFYKFRNSPFDVTDFARHVYVFGLTMVVCDNGYITYGMCVPSWWDKNNKIVRARIQYQRPDGTIEIGKEYTRENFALLWDIQPTINGVQTKGRIHSDAVIIRQIAECFARLSINIIVSSGKLLFEVDSPHMAESLRKELGQIFGSDSPFGVLTTNGVGTQVEMKQPDYEFNALFGAIKQYLMFLYQSVGYLTGDIGTDKKERLITDETGGLDIMSRSILQNRVDSIETFLNEFFCLTGIKMIWEGIYG